MLEKMVGSLSSRHKLELPHHAALETSALGLQLTDRERKQLERKGQDVDAIKVVAFHAKNLTIPKVNSRTRSGFLTPLMTKGVLLTGPEMHEAFRIHSELKAMQAADQESRRLCRYTNKLDAQALKGAKREAAAQELVERRPMRVEDLAAHSIRRAAQRANAVTIKARKKAETQQEKETQGANRKRCPAECRTKVAEPQRKRRPLQDITPGQIPILKSSQ
ncbi:hypothetical protein PR003_g6049 [Phytophthora rubi]|uniref:Uncharacterized protein n=1 Tax=Phytophthora rubi TaxID=129364 RepID=A0A6A3LCT4_9STRA|nr:hypothetical protein PR002_g13446 [Phytophthora rubi]KAE9032609.1 hypothetical protein PR001_g10532 [Phytophthora rubi]KAE9349125.1 hypothetical protein PR003_g6049 [Phytophthora rubi]